ncbi:hypothetical protein TPHV1_220012 [Treponema phagedenis]|uniref:Uncharacterized protein n=1 Tax=Treponema phagedenis TaxID=162 RepID=A0A0B7GTR6_TREPH|nr:hypothetical protein TPHV1_220012 [Treponema phagedenis]
MEYPKDETMGKGLLRSLSECAGSEADKRMWGAQLFTRIFRQRITC